MMKTLVHVFLLTLLLATASCKKSEVGGNQNAAGGNASDATGGTSSTPPFATKEPERYQATRVTTSSEGVETTMSGTAGSRTFIARDGERRREDYESAAGEKVSYLQLPEGIYVLLPAKKLYAELKPDAGGLGNDRVESVPPDFSPDKLLNETRPESRYEKLGAENLEGRATTKYRVTVGGKTGAAKELTTESLVWVDESLGMPVKTETTSTSKSGSWTTVTMELRDIKEAIDAGIFELPPDYKKVEARELFVHLNQGNPVGKGRE
jgi:hypothetical protein